MVGRRSDLFLVRVESCIPASMFAVKGPFSQSNRLLNLILSNEAFQVFCGDAGAVDQGLTDICTPLINHLHPTILLESEGACCSYGSFAHALVLCRVVVYSTRVDYYSNWETKSVILVHMLGPVTREASVGGRLTLENAYLISNIWSCMWVTAASN